MSTGRITLYIATSVDGYVADADGGVEWLDEFDPEPVSDDEAGIDGYSAFFESVDCLVMGATTYEQVLGFGEWPYEDKPTYVFTHRDLSTATDAVEFVDGDVASFVSTIRAQYDHIWLVGGAQLAQAFLEVNAVDELRLFLIPVLLGDGIPLFADDYGHHRLQLLDTDTDPIGIVEHHYKIHQ